MIGKNQKGSVRNLTKYHLLSLARNALRTLSRYGNCRSTKNKQDRGDILIKELDKEYYAEREKELKELEKWVNPKIKSLIPNIEK